MKKSTLSLTFLATLTVPAVVVAEPAARLVVTHHHPAQAVQAQSLPNRGTVPHSILEETCLPLPSGEPWCVPRVIRTQHAAVSAVAVSATSAGRRTQASVSVIVVPENLTPRDAIAILQQTGWYQHVEPDIVVKPMNWNTPQPNDTWFSEQGYFGHYDAADNHSASSITAMLQKLRRPERNIDVIIMDSGFRQQPDIHYSGTGMNFVYRTGDENGTGGVERSTLFLEPDFDSHCSSEHGIAVASVVAATTNNSYGIAGIVNDITLHPLRVMNCTQGYLSDTAAALTWLVGESLAPVFGWSSWGNIDHLPPYTGKPGVINMSIGGEVEVPEGGEPSCPSYLQNAIDAAVAAGFTIVVPAGNEGIDARHITPANCRNVITVGASSHWAADITNFSNFGSAVDVMARGTGIPVLRENSIDIRGQGTSYASPLVAGIIAAVKKDFDVLTPEEWLYLVRQSVNVPWDDNSECVVLGCGTGQIDALKLYNNAELYLKGKSSRMEYTLNQVSSCRQQWVLDHLSAPDNGSWCDLVDVKINGGVKVYPNENRWELYRKNNDGNLTHVAEADSPLFRVSRAVIGEFEYVYRTCEIDNNGNPLYCTNMQPVDTSELADLPVVCQ